MQYVYVLSKDGKPLMPTKRFGKVRHLLKEKKRRSCAKIRLLSSFFTSPKRTSSP